MVGNLQYPLCSITPPQIVSSINIKIPLLLEKPRSGRIDLVIILLTMNALCLKGFETTNLLTLLFILHEWKHTIESKYKQLVSKKVFEELIFYLKEKELLGAKSY